MNLSMWQNGNMRIYTLNLRIHYSCCLIFSVIIPIITPFLMAVPETLEIKPKKERDI